MCLFDKPSSDNYSNYEEYALAAIGYALVTKCAAKGGDCSRVVSRTCDAGFGFNLLTDGLDTTLGGSRPAVTRSGCCGASVFCQLRSCHDRGVGVISDVVDGSVDDVIEGLVDPKEDVAKRISDVGLVDVDSGPVSAATQVAACLVKETGLSNDSVARGKNWERNQLWREKKKNRKAKAKKMQSNWRDGFVDRVPSVKPFVGVNLGVDSSDSSGERVRSGNTELRASLERKWAAENALAALRAERQLAILEANGIDAEVKKYRTAVCVATERNMVAIEKVHGQLKANGNVSDDDDSRVHTILSDASGDSSPLVSGAVSGTISPNSSASMAEFRAVQKKLLDLEEQNARMLKVFEQMDISLEAFEAKDKSVWTDTPENHVLLNQLYPEGYGMSFDYTVDGKFTVC